jgi:hypothetical protein
MELRCLSSDHPCGPKLLRFARWTLGSANAVVRISVVVKSESIGGRVERLSNLEVYTFSVSSLFVRVNSTSNRRRLFVPIDEALVFFCYATSIKFSGYSDEQCGICRIADYRPSSIAHFFDEQSPAASTRYLVRVFLHDVRPAGAPHSIDPQENSFLNGRL